MKCPICAEEIAGQETQQWGPEWAHKRCVMAYSLGGADARMEIRERLERLHAIEAELEALKAALASSCSEEREQLWEAAPGGGCSRALAAENELEALKKAISDAEPVAFDCIGNGLYYENDPYFGVHGAFQGERKALYTLKGIK